MLSDQDRNLGVFSSLIFFSRCAFSNHYRFITEYTAKGMSISEKVQVFLMVDKALADRMVNPDKKLGAGILL